MFSKFKLYIYGIVLATIAILVSLLKRSKKREKVLEQHVESQEEALRVSEVTDKVTNLIHKETLIERASIAQSIKETKGKINEVSKNDHTELDPEFVRLLNTYTDTVRSKAASDRVNRS